MISRQAWPRHQLYAELREIRASLATWRFVILAASCVHEREVLQALDRVLCYLPGGVMAVEQVRDWRAAGALCVPSYLWCLWAGRWLICQGCCRRCGQTPGTCSWRNPGAAGFSASGLWFHPGSWGKKEGVGKDTGVQSTVYHCKSITCPKVYRLPAAPIKTLGNCADSKPP